MWSSCILWTLWSKGGGQGGTGKQNIFPEKIDEICTYCTCWTKSQNASSESIWTHCAWAHYVLLEHYYSLDFPWWFDRKKFREFCHLPDNVFIQIFKSIWRSKAWMGFSSFFSIISVFSLFFAKLVDFTLNCLLYL